jgi:hypothetical protein
VDAPEASRVQRPEEVFGGNSVRPTPAELHWSSLIKIASLAILLAIALIVAVRICGFWKTNEQRFEEASETIPKAKSFDLTTKVAGDGFRGFLQVFVRGKAAQVGVILQDPSGRMHTAVIGREEMIANFKEVSFHLQPDAEENGAYQDGVYRVTLKTFDPEEIVAQRDVPINVGNVRVEDVHLQTTFFKRGLGPGGYLGEAVKGFKLLIGKDGDLPVKFGQADVRIAGSSCRGVVIQRPCVAGESRIVELGVMCGPPPTQEMIARSGYGLPPLAAFYAPGERVVVSGSLRYGKGGNKSVDFQKEVMVTKCQESQQYFGR